MDSKNPFSAHAALPAALQRQLAAGEQVLWHGRPRQGLMLRPADAFLIPFSLLWGGFAVFWEINAWRMDAPLFFKLWGIPFVLLGLYIIAGRFWVDARMRARTHYALTTERILIISGLNGLNGHKLQSLPLRTLPPVTQTERADGSGVITLGHSHPAQWLYGLLPPGWPGAATAAPELHISAHAQHVFQLIRDAQRQAA